MENTLADKYKHIKGWGIDADPKNEPTYPMKNYTGDDHKRLNWERPPLQTQNIEVLTSTERPNVSAVFGTAMPPKGLSGAIRRYAFTFSENRLRRWFGLVLADRVNMVEGLIEDVSKGYIPNVFAERGWGAEWKYNRKSLLTKVAVGAAVVTAVAFIYLNRDKKREA